MRLIQFNNATLGYGRKIVLKDISFSIDHGEFFGLVGPNGAGKTTLLRAILGTLKPIEGEVILTAVEGGEVRFGYVPQQETVDYILPYTVGEVVMMGRYRGLGLFHRPSRADHEAVEESLNHSGILNLKNRPYKKLSGGQKQRTLIARALVSKPGVLVLDEPTNGMDLTSRVSILDLIDKLHSDEKLTVIMVSHMLDDLANHVKRLAIVENEFFKVGLIDDLLTEENLSAIYQLPVGVATVGGQTKIFVRERDGK